MEIRKLFTIIEETRMERGREVKPPTKKAAAVAIIKNPYAGKYSENLELLYEAGRELGTLLGTKALEALGIKPDKVENYGKAAIIGLDGELEHAAAILHPYLGDTLRAVLGRGLAVIPSAKKVASAGTVIDVPLHFKDAVYVRSNYDAMEVRAPDAPRPDECVVAIVLTDSGRPLPRVGGLRKQDISKWDGQR